MSDTWKAEVELCLAAGFDLSTIGRLDVPQLFLISGQIHRTLTPKHLEVVKVLGSLPADADIGILRGMSEAERAAIRSECLCAAL